MQQQKPENLKNLQLVEWFDERFYKAIEQRGEEEIEHRLASTTTILNVSPKYGIIVLYGNLGKREADKRIQEAKDRGSRVHHGCYAHVNGGCVVYRAPWNKKMTVTEEQLEPLREKYGPRLVILEDQREAVMVWRFSRWLKETKALILSSELTVAFFPHEFVEGAGGGGCSVCGHPAESVEHFGYAGTLDHLVYLQAGKYNVAGSKPLEIPETGEYIVDLKTGYEYDDHGPQLGSYDKGLQRSFPEREPVKGGIILYLDADTKKGIPGVQTRLIMRTDLDKEFRNFNKHFELWRWAHPNLSPEVFEFPAVLEPIGAAVTEEKCPDGLTPDGETCPRCGGNRAPSGVGGGTWVHFNKEGT